MTRNETCVLMNMCMVYDGSKILFLDRMKPDWPGVTFPGGHVENGESFTDAVIREVFEETGLAILYPRLCGIKDWISDEGVRHIVLLYKTDRFSGNLQSSSEGRVFWAESEEISTLRLADGMDRLLKIFLDDDLSEQFFTRQDGKWLEIIK